MLEFYGFNERHPAGERATPLVGESVHLMGELVNAA